jgi:Glycerophosphoryl diester phosphodiesterase
MKKWILATTILLLIGYLFLAVTPNLFVKKSVDMKENRKMQIIAHRGGAGIGMENTLSCIEKGITFGADMIEIDIHLTKDGYLVVFHDETVDRTTNGKGKIREMTLAEIRQLRMIDKNNEVTNEYPPTLEEVLSLVDGRTKLLIEVKQPRKPYQGIEQKLVEEIMKYQAVSWVAVQSFDDSVLATVHAIAPNIRLEKLFIFKLPGLPILFDGSFSKFSYKKYNYVSSFNIFHQSASARLIREIHKQGKEVKIWTIDGPEGMPNLPANGVITDRPDLWK